MKIPHRLFFELAVFLAVVALGWTYLSEKHHAIYQTVPVTRGALDATVSATGNCNAVVSVQVGSQVSGNILALYADFNTKVKQGQLVARIDPAPFQAAVDQANAVLAAVKAA